MPVRITSTGDPATFAITADELQDGIDNFNAHYNVATGTYTGQDYYVGWAPFSACVDEYKTAYPMVAEENIAIRFVHAYDEGTTTLYMRMVICEMELTTVTEYSAQVYQIPDNGRVLWYEIKQESITPTAATLLFDEQYLDSFVYKPVAAADTTETLSEDGGFRFVRTLTYPWQAEILQMYIDNGEPNPTETTIHFASASYTAATLGSDSVRWPHGLVMYLAVNNMPLLDNNNYLSIFHYKGADMGTMCPPKCNSYITPVPVL